MDSSELAVTGVLGLPDEDRGALAGIMRLESRPRGHVLVEEGDISDKFFLLVDGHVTVHRSGHHVTWVRATSSPRTPICSRLSQPKQANEKSLTDPHRGQ